MTGMVVHTTGRNRPVAVVHTCSTDVRYAAVAVARLRAMKDCTLPMR